MCLLTINLTKMEFTKRTRPLRRPPQVNATFVFMTLITILSFTRADTCFTGDTLPDFLQATSDVSAFAWRASVIDNANTYLYLAGDTVSSALFINTYNPTPVVAKYDIANLSFVWVKGLICGDDFNSPVMQQPTSITLSDDETTLVVGGTIANHALFIIINPSSGRAHPTLSSWFKIYTDKTQEFISPQSTLLAGDRLYFAGKHWQQNEEWQTGSYYFSGIQVTAIDLTLETTVVDRSNQNSNTDFGAGTLGALINVNPGQGNGSEKVLIGGGWSPFSTAEGLLTDEWKLGIFKVDPTTGELSSIDIQYTDSSSFPSGSEY